MINEIIQASLDFLKCPYVCEVNVLLTDNDSIHEINNQQRNIDRATDVLSFPLIDYTIPGNFDGLEDSRCDNFDLTTGELLLGDIVISIDKVYEQAAEYNHQRRESWLFLLPTACSICRGMTTWRKMSVRSWKTCRKNTYYERIHERL